MSDADRDRFRIVMDLFEDARHRTMTERERHLRRVCSDAELREEVLALLREHDDPTGALAEETVDAGLRSDAVPVLLEGMQEVPGAERKPRAESVPDRIGPYEILETLGEGGMGIVVLAEQTEPLRRRVALKLIRSGMGSREIVARFEAERQALALMNHPYIARVHDAGQTDGGRPFFVMEYVAGEPITTYCDGKKLGLRERLILFNRVCDGIQHAHQKGVIHRDLKPGNVLVTEENGTPAPKIIDFGIAKATDQRLTERTLLFTELGRLVGTPEYMSPEQASGDGSDIDTRTDIYSLGVLLYELLVGKLPFESATLRRRGYAEIQRIIREDEPEKPSTRVGSSPRSVARALRGDLDWIVMKALEKDRSRRYQVPSELMADLGRHLAGEPVLAGPPSVLYRMTKFIRRHRIGVGAVAGIFIALMIGTLASVNFARESIKSERLARMSETDAKDKLEDLMRLADTRRLRNAAGAAQTLWPAYPDRVEAIEILIRRAEDLEANLADHRRSLGSLPTVEEAHPDDQGLRWQRSVLTRLVRDLEDFCAPDPMKGVLASLRSRLEFARSIRRRSIEDYRCEWDEAISTIADPGVCPAYEGLQIQFQMGLVPLGRDPKSGLFEFCHLQTGIPPRRGSDGRLEITEETGLVFVLLPGGTFDMGAVAPSRRRRMGSPNVDPLALPQEGPVTSTALDPFFLSRYEMTQSQWIRVAGSNPSNHTRETGYDVNLTHPVENVTWEEFDSALRRLGLLIPTEAQWEYGARGGTTTSWYTGGDREALMGHANLADRSAGPDAPFQPAIADWPDFDDGFPVHAPVGSLGANAFGLHDVHGNNWEWVREGMKRYTILPRPGDGERRAEGGDPGHLSRGGSFKAASFFSRITHRQMGPTGSRFGDTGIRPARRVDSDVAKKTTWMDSGKEKTENPAGGSVGPARQADGG